MIEFNPAPKPPKPEKKERKPIKRGKAPNKCNPKRKPKLFQQNYGGVEYVTYIKSLPCAICGVPGYSEAAHVISRGAGGKAWHQVPLCGSRFDLLGCHKGFDLHKPRFRDNVERLIKYAQILWDSFQARAAA